MTDIPSDRQRRRRRSFVRLLWIAWGLGLIATAIGFTAPWMPAFDLINEGRPFTAVIAVALLLAAVGLREWPLIRPTAALALLHTGLLVLPWARGADTAPRAPATLRLVTFDIGTANERFDDIADFILASGADIVLLQEVSCSANDRLIPHLKSAYANAYVSADGCSGQALLSKRPWVEGGQVITSTSKPLLVWARFQWDTFSFALTGVRFAAPLAPNEQAANLEGLRRHLALHGRNQILAGSFNLTPFAWKFAQLDNAGLGHHATYLTTWPAAWPLPLFLMDNVLSTDGIASTRIATGPALGSDHRPLIADIAFTK